MRAAAGHGAGSGQVFLDPQHAPLDEEPQPCHLLQPDWPCPAARRHSPSRQSGALSCVRLGGRPAGAGPERHATFVSYPHVLRDGSITPGQHASFLGKAYDPFFIGQDPNRRDFRLPELSLPSSLSIDRLEDRRGLQRLIDQQTDLLSWSETARGIDAFYSRALTMLSRPNVK